jgi:CHASE3 domain sensor protein
MGKVIKLPTSSKSDTMKKPFAAMISEDNRKEFEQRGPLGVRKQIERALYSEEKRKQADQWLDEIEHGPTRALAQEQNSILQESNRIARGANRRATIALVIAFISALVAVVALVLPYLKAPPH